jgi:hypothetical protein
MLGIGVVSQQISQENIMNGLNPGVESGLPGSELIKGAEKPLELAGQKLEVIAQKVRQILEDEFKDFSGGESTKLVDVTMEVVRKIGLGPNTDLTLIAREVQSRTMLFNQEAAQLLMSALVKIQQVLSGDSGSTQDPNKPPLSFLGPKPPSKQNPQGPVLAA